MKQKKIRCIYKIWFDQNPESIYVGSAIDFNNRMIRHRHQLKKGIHKNVALSRGYKKYGAESLNFTIIETVAESDNLIEMEQFYIDLLTPKLNCLKVAGSCSGYKHTQQTKLYLRSLHLGKKMTDEQNVKNSIAQRGNKNAKGSIRSEAHRIAISKAQSRKVINTVTNKTYSSVTIAANAINMNYVTLYAKLTGRNFNNTNLKFI